jgi:hypothetical protein
LLSFLLQACQSLLVNNNYSNKTKATVGLLSIGNNQSLWFENAYTNDAFLNSTNPIKLLINTKSFNKQSHNTFLKAKEQQQKNITVNYIDSVKVKPTYITLSIANKVALLSAFKETQNKQLNNYLSVQDQTKIVNSISLAFNPDNTKKIQEAQEVFLSPYGKKTYALMLYNGGTLTHTILFTNAVVFAYSTWGICWQENQQRQLEITDLVNGEHCPPKTYKKARKAHKKINLYKL